VFAGEDLYITSAEDPEADTKHPESKKYQGGLFKCHVGIRGRRPFVAKIPL
jgi:sugar lactone lactonase YvrE